MPCWFSSRAWCIGVFEQLPRGSSVDPRAAIDRAAKLVRKVTSAKTPFGDVRKLRFLGTGVPAPAWSKPEPVRKTRGPQWFFPAGGTGRRVQSRLPKGRRRVRGLCRWSRRQEFATARAILKPIIERFPEVAAFPPFNSCVGPIRESESFQRLLAGTPTGTVTFFVGKKVVARVALDANGQARLRRSFAHTWRFTVRAVYSGDANFAGSTQSITERVN